MMRRVKEDSSAQKRAVWGASQRMDLSGNKVDSRIIFSSGSLVLLKRVSETSPGCDDGEGIGESTLRGHAGWKRVGWKHMGRVLLAVLGLTSMLAPLRAAAAQQGGLEAAVSQGDAVAVKQLLQTDRTAASRQFEEGRTALHLAALQGEMQVAEALLNGGANVDARDKHGDTPLHLAAAKGNLAIVKMLVARGADVNARDESGATPLAAAAFYKQTEVAALLLSAHANPELADESGDTPLHLAAEAGAVKAAELLLAHNAAVNARDDQGTTPLGEAEYFHQSAMAQMLRQHGASL